MAVNGHGIELPSSWLRQRRSRLGDFARLRSQTRYGGGYTAGSVVWLDYVWPTAGGSTTVDYQVSASSSDSHMTSITNDSGRAPTLSGAVSLTSAILSPGSHGNNDEWSVAARFDGVAVAQGATISTATFQMRCQNTWNAAPNVIKYYVSGQASDNAGALSSTSGDLNTTARPRTTATTIVDWTSLTVDTWYSVDITAIVQEIVNRAGWSSGSAIVILVDTHADTTLSEWQDFYAYDGAAASAPKLSITYASSGGSTSPLYGIDTSGATMRGLAAGRAALPGRDAASGGVRGAVVGRFAASAQDMAGAILLGAVRGRIVATGQDAGTAQATGSARARGVAVGQDVAAATGQGRATAKGSLQGRDAGAATDAGLPRGKGALLGQDAAAAALYAYLGVVSAASPVFGRVFGAAALYGLTRGLAAASGRDAGSSADIGRTAARGVIAVRDVSVAVERGAPAARASATARDVSAGYTVALPDGSGFARGFDAAGSFAYGYGADALPAIIGLVSLAASASDPDLAVVVLEPGAAATMRRPAATIDARRPGLTVSGARPAVDIDGRG